MGDLENTGLTLLIIGVLFMGGYALFELFGGIFGDPTVPSAIRFGILAAVLGVVITIISQILERIKDKRDESR